MNKQYKRYRTLAIQVLLFILTIFTTLMAGAELMDTRFWFVGEEYAAYRLTWKDLYLGIPYSVSFLAFLTFHEFGHYFTAVYHKVKTTLPYYIPIFIPGLINIGSFGAVIRLKSVPPTTRKFFDIGIAGPLAGFIISLVILFYGFATLPDLETNILSIHPEYVQMFGGMPTEEEMLIYTQQHDDQLVLAVGTNLIFEAFKAVVPSDPCNVPPPFEILHYPLLFVGFISLFFTALNLLPIGQLDGGHVIYGLLGWKRAYLISKITIVILLIVGGTGLMNPEVFYDNLIISSLYVLLAVYAVSKVLKEWKMGYLMGAVVLLMTGQIVVHYFISDIQPSPVWLLYSFLLLRFLGIRHPRAQVENRLNTGRKILGWLAVIIFLTCFTSNPLYILQ